MRVSWITVSALVQQRDGTVTSNFASVRYRVLAPIRGLPVHQHQVTKITEATADDERLPAIEADVVVFSKSLAPDNEALARAAQARGARIVFDVCDNHFEGEDLGPHYRAMAGLADQVVCNTAEMAEAAAPYARRPPVVIEDPYEGERREPRFQPGPGLDLLWFGHPLNLDSLQGALDEIADFAQRRPMRVTVLTQVSERLETVCRRATEALAPHFTMAARAWSPKAQAEALSACDAVIIPSRPGPSKRTKSANRMVEALWAGRPAVAQPLPAYEPFAAWTPVVDSMSEGLAQLLERAAETPALIAQAQDYIARRYAPEEIARQWDAVLRATAALAGGPAATERPPDPL